MDYRFKPSCLAGEVCLPASKSLSHRQIFMAMLAKKTMRLNHVLQCDDTKATLDAFAGLGARYHWINDDCLEIDGRKLFTDNQVMAVGASASTLRFMIPLCLIVKGTYTFKMTGQLSRRSLAAYETLLSGQATFERRDDFLIVSGQLQPGNYQIDGSHSSQYITGLLMALPLLSQDSTLTIQLPMVSKEYIAMTIEALTSAGIDIKQKDNRFFIAGGQHYQCFSNIYQPDASAACFFEVAKYLGQPLTLPKMMTSHQADAALPMILAQLAKGPLRVDVADMPDAVPALALAMALSPYRYEITNAKRLRDKECDRLMAVATTLNQMQADVTVVDEGLVIQGKSALHGATVTSYHDHRIAMMIAIAASVALEETVLLEGQCVTKSWPHFYQVYQSLGGKVDELSIR